MKNAYTSKYTDRREKTGVCVCVSKYTLLQINQKNTTNSTEQ